MLEYSKLIECTVSCDNKNLYLTKEIFRLLQVLLYDNYKEKKLCGVQPIREKLYCINFGRNKN